MAYQIGRDYTGALEKKNALGVWAKKHISLTSTTMSISDKEGEEPQAKIDVGQVLRGGEGQDPLVLVIVSHANRDEKTPLRAESEEKAKWWYELLRNALEATGRQKPRSAGLPDKDPRHGLRFEEIPPQFLAKFQQLDNAVLYWFSPIKKYGAKSLVGRHSTESRITFVTDKCLFVTKPDSEVTRCMRVTLMTHLYTNLDKVENKEKDEVFLVIKMKEPDYDLYLAQCDVARLVRVLQTLFKHLTKGRELPVTQVKTPAAEGVNMQLSRKGNFEMKVVVPLQKDALKQALDAFAAEKGIVFNKSGEVRKARSQEEQAAIAAAKAAKAAAGGGAAAGGAAGGAAKRKLEPIDRFLGGIGLGHYADLLRKQAVDLDVLECMEDDEDFKNFGVKDPEHIKKIRLKLKDNDYLDKCKAAVKDGPIVAEGGSAGGGGAAAAAGGAKKDPLADSDDDLLGGTASKPAFAFDDSDDDLLAPAGGGGASPSGGGGVRLLLDSDSDDDLLGSSTSAGKVGAIALDSDDDI